MTELLKHSAELVTWASDKIHFEPRPDVKSMGLLINGQLKAVTLWDGFSKCDCNIHIASDGSGHWLTRKFLGMSFFVPFVQWDMRRVTALVPARNERALKFDYHLGFTHEGYCRNALPDDDLVILGMLREDCRFIHSKYRNQKNAQ